MIRFSLRTLLILLAIGPQGKAAWFIALFLVAWVTAAISWAMAMYYMFKTVANRKPGLRLWKDAPSFWSAEPWWMRNPFNHILVTDHLTETGITSRRRLIYSVLCSVVPILIVVLVGALANQLD